MASLVRIIYISRSTFAPVGTGGDIEPNVARILAKSRINNRNNGLVGVLYFGDGNFFQCLEGESTAIDTLYAKLQSDPRHKDLKLLSRKNIQKLSFSDWAMKYVPLESQMNQLLKQHGYQSFDPYKFDVEMVRQVMSLLHNNQQVDDGVEDGPQFNRRARTQQRMNLTAIIMSGLAMAMSATDVVVVLG